MSFKTDIVRQTLLIYCGLGLSGCLGLYCAFILVLHIPLMYKRYSYAVFLELDIFNRLMQSFLIVGIVTFISASISFTLFLLFINIKFRKQYWKLGKVIIILNSVLLISNMWCGLMIIDPIGYLVTDIQYKLNEKLSLYNSNQSNLQIKEMIDNIQLNIKCCGVNSPTDWFNVRWLPFDELIKLSQYQNQFGLISLAPLSCCDRYKAIICPLNDEEPLKRYYTDGCRSKLADVISKDILTSELILLIMAVLLQLSVVIISKIAISSISSMVTGKYGEDIGSAKLNPMVPNRNLELQCRGMPLHIPKSVSELPNQMQRFKNIEDRFKIGRITDGSPYIRSIRSDYILSSFQHYLRLYIPIFERVIFDEDPHCLVVIYRFIMKGLFGCTIGVLFLLTFSTQMAKQEQKVTATLNTMLALTILTSFSFAFIKSKKFRTVGILMIPNLALRSGRAFFFAELLQCTVMGPINIMTGNIQQITISLYCSMELAKNISDDAQRLAVNPMRNLLIEAIESTDRLKRITLDVYNATRPIKDEIENSGNKSKAIRNEAAKGNHNQSVREVNLKNRFSKLLTSLDRQEQLKFQRKTKKLRVQYAKLRNLLKRTMVNIDRYQDVFSNKSSTLSSNMRTKMFSGCSSIELMKTKTCQNAIMGACKTVSLLNTFGVNLVQSCSNEMDSGSSCKVKEAMEQSKRCASEQDAGNAKDGFGAVHHSTTDGLGAFNSIFGFNVRWHFHRPKFNVSSDDILKGTAYLTFTITDGLGLFVNTTTIVFLIMRLLLLLTIYRAYRYCQKYLNKLDYDNIYVTKYFEYIDEQRKNMNRTNLLPLKGFEKKKLIHNTKMYTKKEMIKMAISFVKITAVVVPLCLLFLVADLQYQILYPIKLASSTELHVHGDDVFNVTTTGEGVIKHLMDVMLKEVGQIAIFNATYSLRDCAPDIQKVSEYYRSMFRWLLFIIYSLVLISGYCVRSRHVLCAYFYPKRERQRIVFLYNKILLNRKRYMQSRKNLIIQKIKFDRLELEFNMMVTFRHEYPSIFGGFLKRYAKYRCLVCNEKEKKGFIICEEDYSAYCKECYEDLSDQCLVCKITEMRLENDNWNNYFDNQLPSASSDDSLSSDDSDRFVDEDYIRMVEDSREVVGWSKHPAVVLKKEIQRYKQLRLINNK